MFFFAEWDSPLSIVLEVLLSLAVIVVIMWLARRTNLSAAPPRELPGGARPMPPAGQAPLTPEDDKDDSPQTGSRP